MQLQPGAEADLEPPRFAEQFGSTASASDLYLRDGRFESPTGTSFILQEAFRAFLSLSKHIPG
jgi:hypothetical protein